MEYRNIFLNYFKFMLKIYVNKIFYNENDNRTNTTILNILYN